MYVILIQKGVYKPGELEKVLTAHCKHAVMLVAPAKAA